jgi:L-lactate utilization protein LutB
MMTDDQRRAFADLIKDAERRFESGFNDYFKELKDDLTPKLEAKSRAKVMMENVRSLRGKLAEGLNGLRRLGYNVDDGMIAIDYDTHEDVRRELEEVKRSAIEERNKSIAKFRKAIFDVWSAQDVEQAKRIAAEVMQ